MKIVISGATGLLGSELAEHFSKCDEVFSLKGSKDINILDFSSITETIVRIKPHLIIHAAAMRDLDICEENPEQTYLVNTLGTRNLLNAARKAKSIFAYISSNSVFDGKKENAYTEFDEVNPINVYGKSKLKSEEEVKASGIPCFILRVPYLYGIDGHPDRNYILKIVKALKTNMPMILACDQKDNPTYVKDLAFMIEKVIKSDAYGLYHLGNKGTASRYEFAVEIAKTLGLQYENILIPKTIQDMKRMAPRPANTTLSTLVYETIFDKNIRNWKEALHECLEKVDEKTL
ncbi:NAD(P)-dependent oxidoreductase [Tepidanaerobacter syntrophicus]|uniref:dTDP-4-dehydrorhamnose reductase n=1 Tax=Tepidanaerobacter syntrophicus TaxID=224999 RepID=A0A0U9HG96_9FIRM|nr:dTDP-4-dehydrorhamnose reductase [Tepidanaerobacter syntrophicus]GAQ25147.1 dTDP-4-dehydrorhamnose reductase [Tepidanaerobacter syntrophicus]GLI18634.1 NAD(P)-dependent oxidoreductase [Tepidanaerobacter syntrophicus]